MTVQELLEGIPQLKSMPLATRVCSSITDPSSGDYEHVDFKMLVSTMAVYKSKNPHDVAT